MAYWSFLLHGEASPLYKSCISVWSLPLAFWFSLNDLIYNKECMRLQPSLSLNGEECVKLNYKSGLWIFIFHVFHGNWDIALCVLVKGIFHLHHSPHLPSCCLAQFNQLPPVQRCLKHSCTGDGFHTVYMYYAS